MAVECDGDFGVGTSPAICFSAVAAGPPLCSWKPDRPGNVLEPGDAANLMLEIQADTVTWTVFDFWHHEVEAGTTPVVNGDDGGCRDDAGRGDDAVDPQRVDAARRDVLHVEGPARAVLAGRQDTRPEARPRDDARC